MLICSCHTISHRDIDKAVRALLAKNPDQLVTPKLIYAWLEKDGRCFGCFPRAFDAVVQAYRQWRAENAPDGNEAEARIEAMRAVYLLDFNQAVAERRRAARAEREAKDQVALWSEAPLVANHS